MQVRKIDYYDEGVLLEATVAFQEGDGRRPIIFIFHAWDGKGNFVEEKAVEIAELGFIGCALDLYGKGFFGRNREECSFLMNPLVTDRAKLCKRILAYRSLLASIPQADPNKMGAIGFCFGGLAALDLARSGEAVKGVVSFHGLLHPPKDHSFLPIRSKVLVFHGYKDPMVSPEDLLGFAKEMESRNVDFQLHVFGQAMHAFMNKEANDPVFGTVYQKEADKRSWDMMSLFFKELFA